jgi:hypothetical protein
MKFTAAITVFALSVFGLVSMADAEGSASNLYFISPADGDVVASPVRVRFGLVGKGVAPAGVEIAGTGHHHLVIDAPLPAMDETIQMDEQYRHFGKGQTEALITLAPGDHTLQLVLGDYSHVPHDPPLVSKQISITVE